MASELTNGALLSITVAEEDSIEFKSPRREKSKERHSADPGECLKKYKMIQIDKEKKDFCTCDENLGRTPYDRKTVNTFPSYHSASSKKEKVSPFTQKIMSAKLLRVQQLQNQLSEMNQKVAELESENKMLKTLQRRQDNAIRKFEGSKDQLPQLIRSHNEELRVINAKFKQLKISHRDITLKLKQKDSELLNLREQHKHLLDLSRDKHLCEREKLTKKLENLELVVKEQNEKILNLNKKVAIQEKSFKHQLQSEINKHKETQLHLDSALQLVNNLKMSLEGKDKFFSKRLFHDNKKDRLSVYSPQKDPAPEPNTSLSDISLQRSSNSSKSFNDSICELKVKKPEVEPKEVNFVPKVKIDMKKSCYMNPNRINDRKHAANYLQKACVPVVNVTSGESELSDSLEIDERKDDLVKIRNEMENEIKEMWKKSKTDLRKKSRESSLYEPNKNMETAEKSIDEILDKVCNGLDVGQNCLDDLGKLNWDELQESVHIKKGDLIKTIEGSVEDLHINDKDQLLKALEIIDDENENIGNSLDIGKNTLGKFTIRKSKADLMQKIFGEDSNNI